MNRPQTGLKRAFYRLVRRLKPGADFFLTQISGIIHVGGHLGEERELYAEHRLNVLWIEPMEEYFAQLVKASAPFPKQKALCRLITDLDDQDYPFHVSSNNGESSSILDLAKHKEIWTDVTYVKTQILKSVSLSTLIERDRIDLALYDALVMDTQGSELLVLKGAQDILPNFKFIKTEAADFEVYKGCCQLADLDRFLAGHGFRRCKTVRFRGKHGLGWYYDAVYCRIQK
jgi:FkbM family methyltransferase